MGKTPKPLKIWIHVAMNEWPEIRAFQEQGHVIQLIANGWEADADLILGPTCWRMDEQHRKYLDLAISEARKRRYPKGDA